MANKYPLVLTGTTVEEIQSTDVIAVDAGGTGVTTSTGSGSNVLSTSPTLVTPALGTPSSGTLTSCTGLPLSTGVTGTLPVANGGTGVTTSTGSGSNVLSTSPTLVTPALGTPSSGTLTSCTGLPLSTGVTGTLPVANGGTGATSLTANNVLLGNGTSALQVVAPGTAGNILTSNGSTWTSAAAPASGVTTFSAGTTGFTPSTGTSGAVTLAGTLAVANGGTGVTTSTGSGSNVLSTSPTITTGTYTGLRETQTAPSISAGSLTLNCSVGNVFAVALNANITSITFSNVPSTGTAYAMTLSFTADGGARTVTWGASVKWPSGTAPTLTSTYGKVDTFVLTTWDGGTTWYAFVAGQNL